MNLEKYYQRPLYEEVVADGDPNHNPYAKQWDYENEVLENLLNSSGRYMINMENGKIYLCVPDMYLSKLLGINYLTCTLIKNGKQYGAIFNKPASMFRPYTQQAMQQIYYDNSGR